MAGGIHEPLLTFCGSVIGDAPLQVGSIYNIVDVSFCYDAC